MQALKCTSCGANLKPDSAKCDYCGTYYDTPEKISHISITSTFLTSMKREQTQRILEEEFTEPRAMKWFMFGFVALMIGLGLYIVVHALW